MAYPTATPKGMNPESNISDKGVAGGLQTRAWLRGTMHNEALKASVMTSNSNLINVIEPESTKDEIQIGLTNKEIISVNTSNKDVNESDDTITLALSKALDDPAINGNAQYIGEESNREFKYVTVPANDFGRPIASFGFGIDKMNLEWLKENDSDRKLLSQWMGETEDLHKHQAYCEVISENLEAEPIAATAGINPNILFADGTATGTSNGIVPYDSTLATFTTAIDTAAASTTAASNHLDVPQVLVLCDQAQQNFWMTPLKINGMSLYKMYASREEVRLLRDPSQTTGYGRYYLDAAGMADVRQVVPNAKLVIGDMIIIIDERNATMESDGAGNLTWGYITQGRGSSRATGGIDTTTDFNVNVVVGQNSLIEFKRDMVDIREDEDDYGRNKGTLIRQCSGCKLPMFDVDTIDDTTMQQEGALLVITSKEQVTGD